MLGGQAALLVGLVAFTAWRMTRPRPQPSEPLAHQPDEPDVPAPHRPALGRRQLPAVVTPPCIPRPSVNVIVLFWIVQELSITRIAAS